MKKPDAEAVPVPASSEAARFVDAWLIDHFGTSTPQAITHAARDDLKRRVAALKES